MNKKTTLLFLFLCAAFFCAPAFAGIQVEPTITELIMPSSESAQTEYKVTNTGDKALVIDIEIEDWMGRLLHRPDKQPVSEWLQIEPAQVELQPGETSSVKVTALTPDNFGTEKVAQVFFSFPSAEGITSRLGVIYYISPKGQENLKAEITDLAIMPLIKGKKVEVTAKFTIMNHSNVHIRPRGVLSMIEKKSSTTLKTWLMDAIPGIYPDQAFTWQEKVPAGVLPAGEYRFNLALDYGYSYSLQGSMSKETLLDWHPKKKPGAKAKTVKKAEVKKK